MYLLLLSICTLLLYMAWQDFADRAIDWFLYPALITLLIINGLVTGGLSWEHVGINLALIGAQLLMLALYYKITKGIHIMKDQRLLGWGDILFFLVLTAALSPINFFAFYLLSLLATLPVFAAGQLWSRRFNQVPLAGCQAILLLALFLADHRHNGFNLYNDTKLINFLSHAAFTGQ